MSQSVTDHDPFGRAIRDHYWRNREEPLIDRDGDETREHEIEAWYFDEHDTEAWRDQWIEGPLLDLGAGVGRDTVYYQEQFETIAIKISEHLVETMHDQGVTDARLGDMFSLRDRFDRDRFQSAYSIGTQVGLAGSIDGVRESLRDLAYVTRPRATAVLDNYAPELEATKESFAYREDPKPGFAYRVYHTVYQDQVGKTLLFRLFSVDRLREATIGTPWNVVATKYGDVQWRAILQKS